MHIINACQCYHIFQAEEPKTCPLTLKESSNDQPMILFIIDIKASRWGRIHKLLHMNNQMSPAVHWALTFCFVCVLACVHSVKVQPLGHLDHWLRATMKPEDSSVKEGMYFL